MNFLKLTIGLVFIYLSVSICSSADYSFVIKQKKDDEKYFLLKSTYFDMNLKDARAACKKYKLKLAEIHSPEDYNYISQLFCIPNTYRIYQYWMDIEWNSAPVTYKWPSSNKLFDPSELPSGQPIIEEFFCPNITYCEPNCARSAIVQTYCNDNSSRIFCTYQNEFQKYALCTKP